MSTQSLFSRLPISPSRAVIPFLNTGPLLDVEWTYYLLPVWWVLGVEQFIWPVLFAVATAKMLSLQEMRIRINRTLVWFALFILAVLFSGLFIVEPERYLTYGRNLGAFVAAFLAVLIVTNRANSWKRVERLLSAGLFAVLVAGLLGLVAEMNIWRPSFLSIAGRLLPASVVATSYGEAIAFRTLGLSAWFSGLGLYFRLNSFFLFSNHYSSVLVYAIPLLFFKLSTARTPQKIIYALGIVLLAYNLFYTTGRVAMISLIAGALYFALFHGPHNRSLRLLSGLGLTVALLGLLLASFVEVADVEHASSVVERVTDAGTAFVFARGEGSFNSRFGVYQASIAGFLERPFFGWGTERDVEGLALPAGSHSEYIAALYRQGLFGLFAFVGLLWSVWRATRPIHGDEARKPWGKFLRYGRWFYVTALINSLLNDPAVDTSTFVLLWLFIALLIATRQLMIREENHALVNR